MAFIHTFHVFDVAPDSDKFRDKNVVRANLQNFFLQYINDNDITSSRLVWINGATTPFINPAPAPNDTVVFLSLFNRGFKQPQLSILAGGTLADTPTTALGVTQLGLPRGGFAEVFWDRCVNHDEITSSLFHEACHLRSGMGKEMHEWKSGFGGRGISVLKEKGSSNKLPSYDDLQFYTDAVKKPVSIQRNRAPTTP
jgi:hypothetical protein